MKVLVTLLMLWNFNALYSKSARSHSIDTEANLSELLTEINKEDLDLYLTLERYESIETQLNESHDTLLLGLYFHERGKLFYRYDQLNAAIEATLEAIRLRTAINDTNVYASLNNIGIFYFNINDYTNAIHYLKLALKNENKDIRYLRALNQLGYVYIEVGQYHLANDLYILGSKICIDKFPKAKERLLIFQNQLKLYAESDLSPPLNEIVAEFKQLEQLFKDKHPEILLDCKLNLAIIYFRQGKYKEDIALNQEILAELKEEEQDLKTRILNNIAFSKIVLKEYGEAHRLLQDNLSMVNDNFLRSAILNNLGELYLSKGQIDSSKAYFKQAINVLLNGNENDYLNASLLDVSPFKTDLINLFNDLTRAQLKQFETKRDSSELMNALQVFNQMDVLVDAIRLTNTEQQTLFYWRNEVKPIYDNALRTAYMAGDMKAAFYYAEKSKAIILLDELVKNNSSRASYVPDSLLQLEKITKSDILQLEIDLHQTTETKEKDALSAKLINTKIELGRIIDAIGIFDPKYVNSKYNPPIKTIQQLKNKLKKNECFISFIWSDSTLFRFVIDHQQTNIDVININPRFHKELTALIHSVQSPFKNQMERADFYNRSHKIYSQLFAKAALQKKKIILSADGLLNFLPFEILVTKFNDQKVDYLLKDKVISYIFSANTGFIDKVTSHNSSMVAFAPTHYDKTLALSELNFTDYELSPILTKGAQHYTYENADKSALLGAFDFGNLIHIYSHASANDIHQPYPWIAAYNELIYLPEIYNHKTTADLVILSACETNLGKAVSGEGIISLARGFVHAGAGSVMASLWKVNDRSNAEVIHEFYNYLEKGHSKAAALRGSKLKYLKQNHSYMLDPYYWAGIIYIGADDQLSISTKSNSKNRFLIAAILLLFLLIGAAKISSNGMR